ncbi:MAG: hypothetical protein IJA32_10990 [Lachnospiraceae bacterium]|nr:hypothetical protein [Lachnospiraceae bacterium]
MKNKYNILSADKSLFRAKLKSNNEWIYWNVYGEICEISGKKTTFVFVMNSGSFNINFIHYDYIHQVLHLINKDTIGRYFGANDKDGTKIFEGDIIRSEKSKIYFAIKFLDRCFAPVFDCVPPVPLCEGYGLGCLLATEDCTVAGNIYDNSELLGGMANE